MSVLCAENLVKVYKKRAVVNGVSFEVKPGEIVGLLGQNGAGKTTSFYMVVGLVKPDGGKVLLDGNDISRYPMYQRARYGIGYLAQDKSVFRKLTTEQNIELVLEMQKDVSKAERKEICDQLLEKLGLTKLRHTMADLLSGGERRRVEIARVLATKPSYILLDEPFTGVDPIAIEDLQLIIADLKKDNIGVLFTDHNVHATMQITDRAYIISDGEIMTSGSSLELAHDPIARKYYLGEAMAGSLQESVKNRASAGDDKGDGD